MDLLNIARDVDERLYHACKAADNCADIMLYYYEKDYTVEYDESENESGYNPGSGLSLKDSPGAIKLQVDRYCDRIAREYLSMLYPKYGFVGEESFDPDEMKHDYFWCVDPICGSMGYRKKTGFFGTSVALVRKNAGPLIGVLNCPGLRLSGMASTEHNRTWYSGDFKRFEADGLKVIISANRTTSKQFNEMLNILKPAVVGYEESVPTKSIQVLAGTYDLHFNLPLEYGGGAPKIWDLAASHVFYAVESMEYTDFDGAPLDLTGNAPHKYKNGYIMARNRQVLDRCLEAFQQLKG